jgi:murein DD-endopeptidase MepM/ murein hydrolase activator NlpD
MFGPKRRFSMRHAALASTALVVFCASLAFFSSNQPAAPAPEMAVIEAPLPLSPNRTEQVAAIETSMKAAFDAKPAAYIHAPTRKPGMGEKLATVQSKITNFLQAGTGLFTSKKELSIGKGDTLMEVLVKNNVPRTEAHAAITALAKMYDPRGLRPNQEITVFFHQDPAVADPKFSGLKIQQDIVNTVVLNRNEDGSYKVAKEEKETHRTVQGFRGDINGSLYVSAKAQGVPDAVILDLIKMYSFSIDFQRDIQKGDKFEVMYEQYVTEDGDAVPGKAEIVFSRLDLDGRDMGFYRYKDKNGDVSYYDESGHGAKKSLMSTPIDGARISSGFGMRRHPVLGYSKMHKGMDFAAPRGTPIYAAGDGKIVKLGNFSSYGKYIKIRHQSGIETAYAHMHGYKAGLKNGSRVKQGQVIGYVGSTGRSTGPHLHYEVMIGGRQVNPKSIKLPTGKALAGKELAAFKTQVAQINRQFRDIGTGTALADNAPSRKMAKAN